MAEPAQLPTGDDPPLRHLPRGPHSLPREVVHRSQRTRMLQAVVEVVAEQGYADASVADVIGRAGVSRTTFYQQFADKEECFLEAFRQGAELHFRRVQAALTAGNDPIEAVEHTTREYLAALAEEPQSALALLLEVNAAGERARRLRAAMTARYARLLADLNDRIRRTRPELPELPPGVLHAVMSGIDELVVGALRTGEPRALTNLAPAALYLQLAAIGLPEAYARSGL